MFMVKKEESGIFLRHINQLFTSMAQTVKTFPLRDQIEIKGKLFQVVNSVEMRSTLMNSSSSEITNNS
jgi:hypothetical protein